VRGPGLVLGAGRRRLASGRDRWDTRNTNASIRSAADFTNLIHLRFARKTTVAFTRVSVTPPTSQFLQHVSGCGPRPSREDMGGLVVWLLPHSQFVLPNDIEERKHLRQHLRVLPNKKRVVPARDFDVDVLHA